MGTATKLWSAVGWITRSSLKPSAKVYLYAIEAARQRRHVVQQLRAGHGPHPLAVLKLRADVCGVGPGCVLASLGHGRRPCRDGQARRWKGVGAVAQKVVGILAHEMCSGRMIMLMIPRQMAFFIRQAFIWVIVFRDILGISAVLVVSISGLFISGQAVVLGAKHSIRGFQVHERFSTIELINRERF